MNPGAAQSDRRAFVFAGGGTGGHIYPALAIIEQLRAINPDVAVHLLCSNRSIDNEILSQTDVPSTPIPAMPVSMKPRELMRFVGSWGPSVRVARGCIRDLKRTSDSVVLVAMGGFVTAPCARAARAEKVPVVLVNLDAVPGKANVLISRRAQRVFTSARVAGYESWQRVRPIVRTQTSGTTDTPSARASFGLYPETKTLLITGGSQGAESINNLVRTMIEQQPQAFADWQVIHQVGNQIVDSEIDRLRDLYRDAGISAWVERYIESMGSALSAADLGIGRCGASSVAECWAGRLPCVFFPYPYHKDEHQKHNARVLVDAGAAIVLRDLIDPGLNFNEHGRVIAGLLSSEGRRSEMKGAFGTLAEPDGASAIAHELMGIG